MAGQESIAESDGGSAWGLLLIPFLAIATAVSKLWHEMTNDRVLEAAGRQGIDELGAALKAFPDSIQEHEVGTIFSPTQGEIAASRSQGKHYGGSYSSYSSLTPPPRSAEATQSNANQQGHEQDNSYGHSM